MMNDFVKRRTEDKIMEDFVNYRVNNSPTPEDNKILKFIEIPRIIPEEEQAAARYRSNLETLESFASESGPSLDEDETLTETASYLTDEFRKTSPYDKVISKSKIFRKAPKQDEILDRAEVLLENLHKRVSTLSKHAKALKENDPKAKVAVKKVLLKPFQRCTAMRCDDIRSTGTSDGNTVSIQSSFSSESSEENSKRPTGASAPNMACGACLPIDDIEDSESKDPQEEYSCFALSEQLGMVLPFYRDSECASSSAFSNWFRSKPLDSEENDESFSPMDLIPCGEEFEITFTNDDGKEEEKGDAALQADAKTFANSMLQMSNHFQDMFLCGTNAGASSSDRNNVPWDEATQDSIPPIIMESLKKAEEVLSQSNYGLIESAADTLAEPLRKSMEHAGMIVSTSSYGFDDSASQTNEIGNENSTDPALLSTESPSTSPEPQTETFYRVIETKSSDLSSTYQTEEHQPSIDEEEEEEEANPVDPVVIPTNQSLQEKKKSKKSKKPWFWKSQETKPTKTVRRISTIIRIKTDKIELMTPSCATKYSKKR